MKSKIFSILTIFAMALTFSSCHEDVVAPKKDDAVGQVNLRSLGVDVNNAEVIINSSTKNRTKSRANIDMSDFQVSIYSAGVLVKQWRYADMPELFSLEPGDYTVKVVSHEVAKAEWEHPLFIGEKSFTITADQITEIGVVTCYLSNIKVSIRFDKSLTDLLTKDDAKVTVVANDQGRLEYTPEETRAGYFEALPGSSTLVAEFTGTINRNFETLRHVLTDVQAGQHRIITFKVEGPSPRPDETGGIAIGDGLYLNIEVIDVNLRYTINLEEDNIPDDRPNGSEDPGPGPGPSPGPGPDDPVTPTDEITITSETLDFDKVNSPEVETAVVNITAKNGIEHFLVKIESSNTDFLSSVSELMPTSFDLAYPGDNEEKFASINFPVGNQVIGATSLVFDISQFVPLLAAFPGTHTFTLTITDAKSLSLIKSLTFVAE